MLFPSDPKGCIPPVICEGDVSRVKFAEVLFLKGDDDKRLFAKEGTIIELLTVVYQRPFMNSRMPKLRNPSFRAE
jgi:hypothetical protein